jgi:hypothetical protein
MGMVGVAFILSSYFAERIYNGMKQYEFRTKRVIDRLLKYVQPNDPGELLDRRIYIYERFPKKGSPGGLYSITIYVELKRKLRRRLNGKDTFSPRRR